MQEVTQAAAEDTLPIPLYHGTSTLFLNTITKFGLGGHNPLTEWRVLEFAKTIYPLVEKQFANLPDWMVKAQSFKWMVEQRSSAMNFQHGGTYLSPSPITAVRYATHKRYGSELLTYTLDFLAELVRLEVKGVCDELYRAYPQIFELLDISPAPMLIQVENVPPATLLAENGGDARPVLERIYDVLHNSPDFRELLQQENCRLKRPLPAENLKVWLINVNRCDPVCPEYSLHLLSMRNDTSLDRA